MKQSQISGFQISIKAFISKPLFEKIFKNLSLQTDLFYNELVMYSNLSAV